MTKKIILGPTSYCEISGEPIYLLEKNGFDLIKNPYGRKLAKKELLNLLDEYVVGIVAGLETIDKEVIDSSNIKVVSRVGTGTDNLDLEYMRKKNIALFTTPDAPVQAVAELTIGSLMILMRKINKMSNDLKMGIWKKRIGSELQFKTVLIVGFGRIGQRVAKILKAFDCKILFYDPYFDDRLNNSNDYKKVDLEEGIKQADIISLHVSGNKEILKERHFDLMKRGVFLLNPSRGELINENILKKYLDNEIVGGVWLDTFEQEPYDGDLLNHNKCLLTPHAGSYSKECRIEMEIQAAKSIVEFFNA